MLVATRPSPPLLELLESGDGAVGYLLKDRVSDVGSLVDSVRRVAGGGTVRDPEVMSTLLNRRRRDEPIERLTPRSVRSSL